MTKSKLNSSFVKLSLGFVLVLFFINQFQAQTLYINENALNSPTLSHPKMIKAGIQLSTDNLALGFTGAYSPRKHLGFSVGYLRVGDWNPNLKKVSESGNLVSLAVSTYLFKKNVNPAGRKPGSVTLDAALGLSFGNIDASREMKFVNLDFRKTFLQLGFTYRMKNGGFGLKLKANQIRYTKGNAGYWDVDSKIFRRIEEIENTPYFRTLEIKPQVILGKEKFHFFIGTNAELSLQGSGSFFLRSKYTQAGFVLTINHPKNKSSKLN